MKNKRSVHHPVRIGLSIVSMMFLIVGALYCIQVFSQRTWNYTGRFNVIDIPRRLLISYPASTNDTIVHVTLPDDAYFIVPDGYGYYRFKDIITLSNIETGSDILVQKSVAYSLGIPVGQSKENLNLVDKIKIWSIQQFTKKDIRTINLYNEPIFSPETRKDGIAIDKIDPDKVDLYLTDLFWEKMIKEEPYTVGVFNASNYPGLASGISRLLEHVGYQVVEVSNWDDPVTAGVCKIRIYGDKSVKESASYKRLSVLLPCEIEYMQGVLKRYTFEILVTDAI